MFLQVEKITIIYFEERFFPIFFFFLAVSPSIFIFLLSNLVDAEESPGLLDIFTWLFFSARRGRLIENICFANVNMLNIFFLSLITRTISLFLFFIQPSLSPFFSTAPVPQETNETATCTYRKKIRSRNVDKFMRTSCHEVYIPQLKAQNIRRYRQKLYHKARLEEARVSYRRLLFL